MNRIRIRLHEPSCTGLRPVEKDSTCNCRYELRWRHADGKRYNWLQAHRETETV